MLSLSHRENNNTKPLKRKRSPLAIKVGEEATAALARAPFWS
ncbi:hypothetical protein [Vibrio phage J14]|nr:hypothetical protein [Vibrio phage J14]